MLGLRTQRKQEENKVIMNATITDDATIPDARHLIWVARNLLWQAHAGFIEMTSQRPEQVGASVVCDELQKLTESIDQMREQLKRYDKVPCQNTTMPPCTENAWQHFLEHVQTCYLPHQK
jgi:hypothetical protein